LVFGPKKPPNGLFKQERFRVASFRVCIGNKKGHKIVGTDHTCHRGELSPQPGSLLVELGVTTYGGGVVLRPKP